MTKKIILFLALFLSYSFCVHAWEEHKSVRFEQMVSSKESGSFMIIESKGSNGSGHYFEDMRIYRDVRPKIDFEEEPDRSELEKVFEVRTVNTMKITCLATDEISNVEFTEQTYEKFNVDIIVTTTWTQSNNCLNDGREIKEVTKKVYKWDGQKFAEASSEVISSNEKEIGCDVDSEYCPDGSYVGRLPPECDFEKCSQ